MMKKIALSCIVTSLTVSGLAAPAALAQPRTDQGEVRKEMRAGNVLSLREIERRVVDPLKAQGQEYLGPAYDSTAMAYRLKFIKDGRVTFVDVDARTGRILQRSR